MGKVFENLTWDDLCDMMCGGPEEEIYGDETEETEPRAVLEPRAIQDNNLNGFCLVEKP